MDWPDIAIHAGAAFATVFVVALFGPPLWAMILLTVVTIAFWWAREAWQGRKRYGTWSFTWSSQKLAEAIAPTLSAALAFVVYLVAIGENAARH